MHFIEESLEGLSLQQKHHFIAFFFGCTKALTEYAKNGNVSISEMKLAAKYARKHAIENAHRGNGRHF